MMRGPLSAVLRRARRPSGRPLGASAWVITLAALLTTPLSAQFGYFGQNKIQYRSFDWRVLRGEHVDLYFYPEEEELGRVALAYAEESYGVLERRFMRSEEHTSELQSQSNLVCRLLLEKKKRRN